MQPGLLLTPSPKAGFFYGYYIVLMACLVLITVGAALYSFSVFFEPILTEFGWSRAATSGAYSLFLFLQGLLALPMGRLTDRFGPRLVTSAAAVSLALGYFLLSRLDTLWQLYLFYGVVLAAGVGIWVPMLSVVSRWFVRRRGLMTGITVAAADFSLLVWPPVSNLLVSAYGWRTSYIIIGIVTLIVVMAAAQFVRRDPGRMGLQPDGESGAVAADLDLQARGFPFRSAVRTRQLWQLCGIFYCLFLLAYTIPVHMVIYATGLGISSTSAANILTVAGASTISGVIMGLTIDRLGNKRALIITSLLFVLSLAWLLAARELWMLYLFAVVFGFGFGCLWVLETPAVAELFGLRSHGAITGFIYFVATLGGTTGIVLAGYIFDVTQSYQPAFLVGLGIAVIGLALAVSLRPSDKGENSP
ncbi:MAG: MFS transporter [Chloroflexi bacterium]|nr:MFS transporter [Chloroflexota bacterium]